MDRDTLSQYGWIVITIIILAILIGMATPFATTVRTSIENSVNEFKTQLGATMDKFNGTSDDDSGGDGSGGSGEVVTPTVQAPEVTVDGDELIITDTSGEADRYLIYSGAVLVGNVVSTGTNTKFSLDGLDVGAHTLHVIARADGMNDSDKSTVYYTKLETLQSPALTVENETLIIVDSTQKAETYDVYVGDTPLKTVTAVHPETTVDLSALDVGSHQVSVVAKATDMNESNKVTTSYTKLATLNTPTLSVSGDVLSITDNSGKAEGYDIYDGDTLVTTLTKSGTTTTYDISGLAVGTHSIGVVAKASGMKDSAKESVSYTKLAMLNTPTLSINDEALTITDASGKAEKYAIYNGSNLITTVTSAGTTTTVDLSGFTVGTHTVGVIAKANNMNDSARANINYEKLGTVSTPTLTVNDETLVITDAAGEADNYDIYDGTTWVATVPSAGTTTTYDLSGLSVGSHTVGVIAKADNMKDSAKAAVAFKKLATLATPTLTVDDETLKITDSTSKAESYSVYDGETLIGTVVATNPTTSYDLSGLDVGTHTIKVVAHATEMKDSAAATTNFKKLATLDTPTLSIDGETLVITDSSARAEKFEIYDGNTLIATVTSTGTKTEYSLSTLSAGTHTISVIAKATDMKDSNKVSTEFTMRETVDTPSVTVNDETLIITDNSGKAETYDVYDGTTLIKTVTSVGTTTEVDLSGLSVGAHTINVVAKADDMKDSAKATTTFTKLDTVDKPTVTVDNETLVITDNSGEADVYEVYDGTNLIDTVTSNGTTTEVDLSGLSIGTHAIKVIAKADGRKDAESVTVTFTKLDTVDGPALSVNNETLVITDTIGKADKYEIYDGDTLIATITSAGETTEYDLSDLSVGTHTIGVIGKADDMKDSAKVTTTFTKLATVSTPVLSITDDILTITNSANDADEYEIYNGTTLITTIASAGVTTTYELYDLPAGTYELAVIGKADNCHNSEKATINHTVADYSGYKPDATLDFKTLTLNHDNDADEYVISINGTEHKTVASLGAGESSEYVLDIQFGDVVSVVGYRHDKQIGIATELNANNTDLYFTSWAFDADTLTATSVLNTWDNYYAVSDVVMKVYVNDVLYTTVNGTTMTQTVNTALTEDVVSCGELKAELTINGVLVDETTCTMKFPTLDKHIDNDSNNVCDACGMTIGAEFVEDEDGGIRGTVPPAEEPDTPEEIPETELPTMIEFTGGKFETNTEYTEGTYTEVPYEETHTAVKLPVSYQGVVWSRWQITYDSEGNEIGVEALDIELSHIEDYYGEYIAYDFDTSEYLEYNGVAGDSVQLFTAYNTDEATLENVVYLAAYIQKTGYENSLHIAKWDGTKYVAEDHDSDIAAIKEFTYTYTVTGTKKVQITAPSSNTTQFFVPTGTLQAVEGMTWATWLASEYNTTGLTEPTIRDLNYEIVDYDTEIVADESYSIMEEYTEQAPGLYDANNVLLADWDTLVNTYKLDVTTTYTYSTYKTATIAPYYILNNYDELSAGTQLVIGEGVTSIGNTAFRDCSNLTNITIPDSVTSIGDSAFYNCSSLISATIPDGVTSIGGYAFYSCVRLTSVTIPDSVTTIGNTAFNRCLGLESIVVSSENTVYHSDSNCLIETATKTLIAGCKNSVIPDDGSVTSIGDDAFSDCTRLTSVTIPDSVTSIGDNAFYNCTGLTSVTIPDSVTSIGDSAFYNCSSLTSVTIPDSVTSIGNNAFSGCTGLTNVTIGSGVTKIGKNAFKNCSALTSVTFKDTSTWYYTSSSTATSGGTKVTVTNASTAATYLKTTYANKYWYKS